jgi:hypothetical protein
MNICGFAICDLAHLINLRICDNRMSQEFTNLRILIVQTLKESFLAHL